MTITLMFHHGTLGLLFPLFTLAAVSAWLFIAALRPRSWTLSSAWAMLGSVVVLSAVIEILGAL